MQNKATTRAKHLDFIILDFLAIEISYVLSYFIRFRGERQGGAYEKMDYVVLGAYFILMLFGAFHKNILKRGKLREFYSSVVVNVELVFVVFAVLFVLKKSAVYSRLMFGYFFVIDIFVMFLIRLIWKAILKARFRAGKGNSNVVLVTYSDKVSHLYESLQKDNSGYQRYIGAVVLDGCDTNSIGDMKVISEADILEFAKNNVINEVYVYANNKDSGALVSRFSRMGFTVHVVLNLELRSLENVSLDQVDDYTILTTTISNASIGQLIVKRLFDIVVGLIGLIFTALFTIIVAPIIKIQAPGPVFFAQKRVGKNGKIFKMYKFRSMYTDAEERKKELMAQNEMKGLMFKMENDPRIFPAGNFLRKTSVDEFPQFWNILKGDMSLVGTRPPTLDEYEQYSNHHLSRLAMKPGLTGMWQTSGRSDITDFEEIVKLDTDYIRHFSLGLDVKIIIKTFAAVLGMKGSK